MVVEIARRGDLCFITLTLAIIGSLVGCWHVYRWPPNYTRYRRLNRALNGGGQKTSTVNAFLRHCNLYHKKARNSSDILNGL